MGAPIGNKFAVGNNGGASPMYTNAEDLKAKCEEYFENHESYTITGLALYLGFCHRSSLDDYSKKKEYAYIIKRAKLVVESGYEEMFHNGSNAGIFPLKNMGWRDKTEVDNTHEIKTTTVKWGDGEITI